MSLPTLQPKAIANPVASDNLPFLALAGSLVDATNLNGARGIAVADGWAFVCAYDSDRFTILDVSADTPVLAGTLTNALLDGPRGVAVAGDVAAVITSLNDALVLIDVSDKDHPVIVGSLVDNVHLNGGHRVEWDGRYVYTTGTDYFSIIDCADPTTPVLVGSVNMTGEDLFGFTIKGDTAFIAASATDKYWSVDITNKAAPTVISSVTLAGSGPHSIVIEGRYGYTANSGTDSVNILDVSDPAAMTQVGVVADSGALNGAHTLVKLGRYLLVCAQSNSGFAVVDATDPTAPVLIGSVSDSVMDGVRSMAVAGSRCWGAAFTADAVACIDLKGLRVSTARIGDLRTDTAATREGSAERLKVHDGLTVGPGGIMSLGPIAAAGGVLARAKDVPVLDAVESTFSLSGFYTVPPHSARSTAAMTVDRLHLLPFRIRRATSFTMIGAELTTALATSVLRLGAYAASPTTRMPTGAPLFDVTLSGAGTPGWFETAITVTFQPGLYYLAGVQQVAAATWRIISVPNISLPVVPTATPGSAVIGATSSIAVAYRGAATVSGALQSSPAILTTAQAALFPLVGLLAA